MSNDPRNACLHSGFGVALREVSGLHGIKVHFLICGRARVTRWCDTGGHWVNGLARSRRGRQDGATVRATICSDGVTDDLYLAASLPSGHVKA